MPINLQDFINLAKRRIGMTDLTVVTDQETDSDAYLSDAGMRGLINKSLITLFTDLKAIHLQDHLQISTSAFLPTDMIRLMETDVKVDGVAAAKRDFNSLRKQLSTSRQPTAANPVYTIKNHTILYYPISGALEYSYLQSHPSLTSNSSIISIDDKLTSLLLNQVLSLYFAAIGDYEKQEVHQILYRIEVSPYIINTSFSVKDDREVDTEP